MVTAPAPPPPSSSSTGNTEQIFALSTEFEAEEEYNESRLTRTQSPGLKDNIYYSSVSEDEGGEEVDIFSLFMDTGSDIEVSTGTTVTTSEYSSDPDDANPDYSSDFCDSVYSTEINILPQPALYISAYTVEGKLAIRDSIPYTSHTSYLSEVFIPTMEDEAV